MPQPSDNRGAAGPQASRRAQSRGVGPKAPAMYPHTDVPKAREGSDVDDTP